MSNSHVIPQDKLESKQAKQKRKEFWDKVWTIIVITLLALFVIWNIVTVISHHI